MRLVVRRVYEGAFFRSPNQWVKSVKDATEVDSLESALKCLDGRDLSGLDLVVLSEDGRPGVGFTLTDLVRNPKQ